MTTTATRSTFVREYNDKEESGVFGSIDTNADRKQGRRVLASIQRSKLEGTIAEIRTRQAADGTSWGIIVTNGERKCTDRLKREGYDIIARSWRDRWSISMKTGASWSPN